MGRFLLICLGGAIGTGARFLISTGMARAFGPQFPRGTILINVTGSFLIALVMAMVERCPSGALTYSLEPGGADIEPDLPEQVALTTEIISTGPIEGPLWVTGGIPVRRSDGQPLEIRNRVTLCNCGRSCNKPLCDGTHREMAERQQRAGK